MSNLILNETPIEPAGMTLERAMEIALAVYDAGHMVGVKEAQMARVDEAIDYAVKTGANDIDSAKRAGVDPSMVARRRRARGIGTVYERQQQRLAEVRAGRAA